MSISINMFGRKLKSPRVETELSSLAHWVWKSSVCIISHSHVQNEIISCILTTSLCSQSWGVSGSNCPCFLQKDDPLDHHQIKLRDFPSKMFDLLIAPLYRIVVAKVRCVGSTKHCIWEMYTMQK